MVLNKYLHNNNYPNLFTQYLNAEIKIKHKQIIIIKRVWVNVTVCVHENGHCRLVRVDDSAMCSETKHCSLSAGGELNCIGTDLIWNFGCGGGPFQLGFGFSGGPNRIGLQVGLGLLGVYSSLDSGSPNQTGLLGQVGLQTVKAQFELTLTLFLFFLLQPFDFCPFFLLRPSPFSPLCIFLTRVDHVVFFLLHQSLHSFSQLFLLILPARGGVAGSAP